MSHAPFHAEQSVALLSASLNQPTPTVTITSGLVVDAVDDIFFTIRNPKDPEASYPQLERNWLGLHVFDREVDTCFIVVPNDRYAVELASMRLHQWLARSIASRQKRPTTASIGR